MKVETVEEGIQVLRERAQVEMDHIRRVGRLGERVENLLGDEGRKVVELMDEEPPLCVELTRRVTQRGFQSPTGIPNIVEMVGLRVKEVEGGDNFQFTRRNGVGRVNVQLQDELTVHIPVDSASLTLFEGVLSRVSKKLA